MRAALPLLVAAAFAAAGAAAAQDVLEGAAGPVEWVHVYAWAFVEGPLEPGAVAELRVEAWYSRSGNVPTLEPTRVLLDVTAAPWWIEAWELDPAEFTLPAQEVPCACFQQERLPSTLRLRVAADAPAFEPGPLDLRIRAEANGLVPGAEGWSSMVLAAGFAPATEATLDTPSLALRDGQERAAGMVVVNHASAPARIEFSVRSAPRGVHVLAPDGAPVGREGAGPGEGTLRVAWVVRAEPGFEPGEVELVVHTLAGGEAFPLVQRLRVDRAAEAPADLGVAGGGNHATTSPLAPVAGAAALALGLAAAGLALRRRRG